MKPLPATRIKAMSAAGSVPRASIDRKDFAAAVDDAVAFLAELVEDVPVGHQHAVFGRAQALARRPSCHWPG